MFENKKTTIPVQFSEGWEESCALEEAKAFSPFTSLHPVPLQLHLNEP